MNKYKCVNIRHYKYHFLIMDPPQSFACSVFWFSHRNMTKLTAVLASNFGDLFSALDRPGCDGRLLHFSLKESLMADRFTSVVGGHVALVVVDAMREMSQCDFSCKIRTVFGKLSDMGYTGSSGTTIMCQVFISRYGGRHVQRVKAEILSVDLVHRASCIVICGGKCLAILEAFQQSVNGREVQTALQYVVQQGQCLLLAWGAGATASGVSAELTADKCPTQLIGNPSDIRLVGLRLVPGFLFRVHCSDDNVNALIEEALPLHYVDSDCILATIPNGAYLVWWRSYSPVYWSSNRVGWVRTVTRQLQDEAEENGVAAT